MKKKTIRRNISESRELGSANFRVKFNDKNAFDVLQIEITREKTGEKIAYYVESEYLPTTDSIYFYFSITNNELSIRWSNSIAPNMKQIR